MTSSETSKKVNVLYTAEATAEGGRKGHAKTSDGRLEVQFSSPTELGGDGGPGTNPEQLFAAGYAACFIGAIKLVAGQEKIAIASDVSIQSSVSIGKADHGFGICVELKISIPGLEKNTAEKLVGKAHQVCPYSNATRGNVDVTLIVV